MKSRFDVSIQNAKMLRRLCPLLFLCISACSPKELELSIESTNVIEGKVSLSASAMSDLTIMSACEGPQAAIYEINNDGSKKEPALMSTIVNATTGAYRFENVKSKGIQSVKENQVKYLVEVLTCNNKIYQRVVTGNKTQNISFASDILSQAFVVAAFGGKDLSKLDKTQLLALTTSLEAKAASDSQDLFNQASADAVISAQFQTVFGMPISALGNTLPKIILPVITGSFAEGSIFSKSVTTSHWLPSYSIVYDWQWEASQVSTTDTIAKTIGKNEQGTRSLNLRVGKDDGGGNVDVTKPYFSKTWNVTVGNNYMPTPPSISVASAITASSSISVDINTGVGLVNCETFSSMALTEDDATTPAAGAFNITCSSGPTQAHVFTLNAANGTKTLRLWAKDSAGNISILPEMVLITLDNQNPAVSLTSLNSGSYRGGSVQNITWTASDSGVGVATNGINLQYSSNNGSTWNNIALSQTNTGSYAWTLPSIDSTQVLVKIIAVDGVANSSTAQSSASLTIDSTVPALALTSLNSGSFKGGTSQNITWTTSDAGVGLAATPISLEYTSDNGTTWNSIASGLTNTGTYAWTLPGVTSNQIKVRVTSVDAVGNTNVAVSSSSMTIDSTAPSLTLTSLNSGTYKGGSNQNITWTASDADVGLGATPIALDYSTDNGSTWTAISAATANDGTEAWTLPSIDNATVKVRVIATDAVGNITTVISSSAFTIDSTAPVIASMTINDGAAATGNNSLKMGLSVSDSLNNVTHFCFKYSTGVTVPTAPLFGDTCWVAVNAPSPGLIPQLTISFNNFYHTVGFTIATYNLYAWAMDSAGQISNLSSAGTGTMGQDKASIYYDPGLPPAIVNVVASSTDTPSSPLTTGDLTASVGDDVYIKWKLTDDYALPATPVTISFTSNESTYTQIVTNLPNTATSGCSVDGVTYTGCYKWTSGSPSSSYFKVRISATDSSSMTTFATSVALNTSAFRFLAGNTETGTGGSATSAMIFNYVNDMAIDGRTMVVSADGRFFIRDSSRGIIIIDPSDGKLNTLIPFTGVITDGPLGTATIGFQWSRLGLDFQGRVLIFENTRVRRLDLTTNVVTTIIGGGGSTADGTLATSFDLNCDAVTVISCPFVPLPNGDIYFFRKASGGINDAQTLYRYNYSDGKVYSIQPSGTGASAMPTMDLATSRLTHFGIEFDPVSSNIQRFFANFLNDPCVGCGNAMYPAQLNTSTWVSAGSGYSAIFPALYEPHSFVNSMDGQIYAIPEYANEPRSLWRLNRGLNTWTKLLGSTASGVCADGTVATSCAVYLQDAFVTAQGQVYFLDNGLVRTIDENNQVRTLFGQRRTFGDGGLALSARFNDIRSIDETSTGNIVILDRIENLLREFTVGGNILKLGGDGTSRSSTGATTALSQSIPGGYWGSYFQIYVDRSNDDIFFTSLNPMIFKYSRATGMTDFVAGGGGTSYESADGLAGTSISLGGYPVQLLGFDGTKLVGAMNIWNGANQTKSYWKFFDKTDSFRQSHFIGNNGVLDGSYVYFNNGDPVSTAGPRMGFSDWNTRGYWDASTSTWYFGEINSVQIKALPLGGNISFPYTLPRGYQSWTMIKNGSAQWVFYYCSGGRVYKYNPSTSTETALTWPHSSIACSGNSMFRNSTRNSIVFPYQQNGLTGVAEIVDTP